ncbi:CX3C chemokine receptor 1 [Thomomys bottae]
MATSFPDYDPEGFEYDESAEACILEDVVAFGAIFLPVLYSVVFAVGLVGNVLVVWALSSSSRSKARSVTDIYLLNLALSDLLFVATLPLWTHYVVSERGLSHVACKLTTALFFVGFFAGIFFITLISVDRYLAIVRPAHSLPRRTVPRGVTRSLVAWSAALLASAPQFMFTKVKGHECMGDYPEVLQPIWPVVRNVEVNVVGFVLPVLVMGFCYCRIIRVLWACRDPKKTRAIRLVLLVVAAFLLFWTPYQVLLFLETLRFYGFFPSCGVRRGQRLAVTVTEALAFAHCCLNPLIYALAGEKFRRYLSHLLRKWLPGSCGRPVQAGLAPRGPRGPDSMLSVTCTQDTSEGQESLLL